MTERGRRLILHALGLSRGQRWSSRNGVAGAQEAIVTPLLREGLLQSTRRIITAGSDYGAPIYRVTDAGIEAAGVANRVRTQDRVP